MKRNMFAITGFIVAFVFWFFDSSIHYFVYGEPKFEIVPSNFNEMWMRIVIVSLVMLFGIFADSFSRKLVKKEKELEAVQIYNSMINATHHILNNLLNQMQVIRLEVLKNKDFNRDVIKDYDCAIDEAVDLIKKLSSVQNITDENIWASVNPKIERRQLEVNSTDARRRIDD